MLTFNLVGRDPHGTGCVLQITVGSPLRFHHDWRCRVTITGIAPPVNNDFYGADPLQAYCIATSRVFFYLEAFIAQGGTLYYEDGTHITLSPNVYFPLISP